MIKILNYTVLFCSIIVFALVLFYNYKSSSHQITLVNGLSINNINQSENLFENLNKKTTIVFGGDAMFARSIGENILQSEDPLEGISSILNRNEYSIINLETSVGSTGSPQAGKLYTFQAPNKSLDILKGNSISAVSLANNHTMDYGSESLKELISNLGELNIRYLGAGLDNSKAFDPLEISDSSNTIHIYSINDVELSYNTGFNNTPGTSWFDFEKLESLLNNSSKIADIVIAFVHWGKEFSPVENSNQKSKAEFLIDNGVDLIIGGHPHVVQPTREIKGKTVIYSIGNLVFDIMYGSAAEGNLVEVEIINKKIENVDLVPYKLDSKGYPILK